MELQISYAYVSHVGLLKHSQPKLTEIFRRTFYMEVHNVAFVSLLAIQVMIVKRSQETRRLILE